MRYNAQTLSSYKKQGAAKKVSPIPQTISGSISPMTENFSIKFARLLYVHIYAKLQNFIQLSLTLTKLFCIKRDHLLNFFYISLEKCKKL